MIISRLVAFAASLAIVAAASLAFTANAQQTAPGASGKAMRVIQLEQVVVTAKRLPSSAR